MDKIIYPEKPTKITRERANEILDAHKASAAIYPPQVVNAALLASGDISPRKVIQREWKS